MFKRPYTLVEVLVTMGIIMILASAVFAVSRLVARKNFEAKTKARLQHIMMALEQYRGDYGYYPIQDPGLSDAEYNSTSDSNDAKVRLRTSFILSLEKPGSGKKYLDWFNVAYKAGTNPSSLSSDQQTWCMDASEGRDGNNRPRCFYYICPGRLNKDKYDLWSKGFDGEHGKKGQGNDLADALKREKNDDITSWKE